MAAICMPTAYWIPWISAFHPALQWRKGHFEAWIELLIYYVVKQLYFTLLFIDGRFLVEMMGSTSDRLWVGCH